MNIFLGDSFNLMEFQNEKINFIATASSWSYKDYGDVVLFLNNFNNKIYSSGKSKNVKLNDEIFIINGYKIFLGDIKSIFNYEISYCNLLNSVDLSVYILRAYNYKNLEVYYKHIISEIYYTNIPVIIIEEVEKKNTFSFINSERNFIFKNSLYSYLEFHRENSVNVVNGFFYDQIKKSLGNFNERITKNV